MSLEDWICAKAETAKPLTAETLNKAMRAIRDQPAPPPRHDCRFDGHVAHLMSTRCVHCGEEIRELTPDENHFRHGEFF